MNDQITESDVAEAKKRKSSVDGHPYKVADAGSFLRSRNKRFRRKTARNILRSKRADSLIELIGMNRKTMEAIAFE